jgi:hypothetical protein
MQTLLFKHRVPHQNVFWSLSDDLSGGDRPRANPDILHTQLILKKNVPVRALIERRSLFDVLEAKKKKKKKFQGIYKAFKAGPALISLARRFASLDIHPR